MMMNGHTQPRKNKGLFRRSYGAQHEKLWILLTLVPTTTLATIGRIIQRRRNSRNDSDHNPPTLPPPPPNARLDDKRKIWKKKIVIKRLAIRGSLNPRSKARSLILIIMTRNTSSMAVTRIRVVSRQVLYLITSQPKLFIIEVSHPFSFLHRHMNMTVQMIVRRKTKHSTSS